MKIALDKQAHFLGGLATCLAFAVFWPVWVWMIPVGLGMAVLSGWLKEEYDRVNPSNHTYDIIDFYFTAAGGVVGLWIGIAAYLTWVYL